MDIKNRGVKFIDWIKCKMIGRRNHQLIKMAIDAALMKVCSFDIVGASLKGIFVVGKNIVEINFRRNADSKDSQKEKSDKFLYEYILFQR